MVLSVNRLVLAAVVLAAGTACTDGPAEDPRSGPVPAAAATGPAAAPSSFPAPSPSTATTRPAAPAPASARPSRKPSGGDERDGTVKAGPTVRLKETDEFGLVVEAGRRGGDVVVLVDRVDSLGGQEAEDAAAARGTDVSNDHFEVNDSPRTRRYVLAGDPPSTTVPEWVAYVNSDRGRSAMFHFDVEDGRVVAIEEQYFP